MTTAPETFTAWITGRYTLSSGIGEFARSRIQPPGSTVIYDGNTDINFFSAETEGKTWHCTREAAVARANEMREAKIASLQRQIDRLRKMEF